MNLSSPPNSSSSSQTSVSQTDYAIVTDSIPVWESLTSEQQQIIVDLYEQQDALSKGYGCPGYESLGYGSSSSTPDSVQIHLPPPLFLNQFAIPQPQFLPLLPSTQQPEPHQVEPESERSTLPELNEGSHPAADTSSDVQIWYYTGRVSDQLQIAYGRVPPSDITPWGLTQFAELKAMAMTSQVEKLVESRKESLKGRGIQLSEAGEQSLYHDAVASVWEEVQSVDRERLENWQQGKACTPCSDFFGEVTQKAAKAQDQPESPPVTGARAKLEETRQQHGTTDPDRKVERTIER